VAFEVGIPRVTIQQQRIRKPYEASAMQEVVEVAVSTPVARAFVDAVTAAPFFNEQDYTVVVRNATSILSHQSLASITQPWAAPTSDVCEELWLFSHITFGFVGRMFIAALILAYGMVQNQLLTMLAGMFFMPFLPLLLALSFGACTGQWRLARQGLLALVVGVAVAMAGGALVALLAGPPLRYDQFSAPGTSFLISLVVGVAAGLATADDAGHREMIGLAATSQIAVLAVWFGLIAIFGLAPEESDVLLQRGATLALNVATIVGAAAITYLLIGMKGHSLRRPLARRAVAAE